MRLRGMNLQIASRSAAEREAAQGQRDHRSNLHLQGRFSEDPPRLSLGVMPALALLTSLGLVLVAIGDNGARNTESSVQALFWIGLALIYGPIAYRLLSPTPSRAERIALVLTLGISLFVVKVIDSPLDFLRFDELGWWRATDEIVRTGHPFNSNPIAVATAGFPGLATVTAAISQLTGLSIFHSGLIVIGVARAALMLALFLLLERVTGSARAAGIGVVVYACNPSFLYFDAQFGYESLALTIAAALLLAAIQWSERDVSEMLNTAGLVGVLLTLTAALTITHHMTSIATLAFLMLWAVVALVTAKRGVSKKALGGWFDGPGLPAAMLLVAVGIWFAFVAGGVTVSELGGLFSRAFQSVFGLIFGSDKPKQLFAGSGQHEHAIARLLALGSIIPLLAVIPLGLLTLWRERERDPLRLALAAVATLYPLTLGFRLTLASSETSQRASEFVFVGVSFLAVIVLTGPRRPQLRLQAFGTRLIVTTVAIMAFIGGFIIGELQATRQPGPYLVGAEDRSITSQGLEAARFAAMHLPPDSRILTDRTDATLLGSYGGLDPIFGRYAQISVPRVLFSRRFDRADRRVVHGQSLAYIVVDKRLTRELPLIGYYVESDEEGAFKRTRPIAIGSLLKFESIPGVSKIYSNGPISIYDTTALLRRAP